MTRKPRVRSTKKTMHLCPDVLYTSHVEGTRCDVRYYPRLGLYDLRDVLSACLQYDRKISGVVKEWRKRLKTGNGLLAHIACDDPAASGEVVWHEQDEAPGKPLERQRSRAVVSAGVAFDILTYCDSTMFDVRILAMRRLMKGEFLGSRGAQVAALATTCAPSCHKLVESQSYN